MPTIAKNMLYRIGSRVRPRRGKMRVIGITTTVDWLASRLLSVMGNCLEHNKAENLVSYCRRETFAGCES